MREPVVPAEGYDGPALLSAAAVSRLVAGAPRTSTTEEATPPAVVSAAEPEVSRLAGARTSTTGDTEDSTPVEVHLRGHFEPLDGRFHWYGRVAADDDLAARHPSGSMVVLTTPGGRAEGRLSDVDPWGRFRISGTGRPPY